MERNEIVRFLRAKADLFFISLVGLLASAAIEVFAALSGSSMTPDR